MPFGIGSEPRIASQVASVLVLLSGSAIQAQINEDVGTDASDPFETIVVRGERSTLEIPPDEVFSEEDISFYGFDSIGEVVDEINSRESRSQDDVVFLVDGKRVGGLGDIANFPAEAIDRIELFSHGAASEVGGSASQRVVNIRLKPNAKIYVANGSLTAATDGGFNRYGGEFNFTQIKTPRRINLGLKVRGNDALLESERDIAQVDFAASNLGDLRSLMPKNREFRLHGTYADAVSPNLNAVLTTRLLRRNTDALLGLAPNGSPVMQGNRLTSLNTNALITGQFDEWLVTANASYGVTKRRTLTDQSGEASGVPPSRRAIGAILQRIAADLNVTRPVAQLPAGPLTLTASGRFSNESVDTSGGDFSQSLRQIGGGVAIPLTNDEAGPVKGIGTIGLGIDLSLNDYSASEVFTNARYSVNWRLADWLRLTGSVSNGRTPPSAELLSAPVIASPGTRYFDPRFDETVDVTTLSGGAPDLLTQEDEDRRLALEIRPQASRLVAFTADYISISNRNIITALPPANTLLLDAFPARFIRDETGRLATVDTRPINFARKSEDMVRYAFELSFPLVGRKSSGATGTDAARPQTIVIPKRLQILFSHAIVLNSEIVVAPGIEAIDLLSPGALGFGGSERSRHEIDLTVRYGARGIGAEFNARHSSAGFISILDESRRETFRFSALSTADIRFFIEGRRIAPQDKFLNGMRFTFSVRNITNSRQTVRNSDGETPLLYQPAYRDPTGRLIEVSVRKRF